jgi:hypothetical protein
LEAFAFTLSNMTRRTSPERQTKEVLPLFSTAIGSTITQMPLSSSALRLSLLLLLSLSERSI